MTARLFVCEFLSDEDKAPVGAAAAAAAVEVAGVVVATGKRGLAKHVFTVDDGTGTVDCALWLSSCTSHATATATTAAATLPGLGDFVAVRGKADVFRGVRELRVLGVRGDGGDPDAETLAWLDRCRCRCARRPSSNSSNSSRREEEEEAAAAAVLQKKMEDAVQQCTVVGVELPAPLSARLLQQGAVESLCCCCCDDDGADAIVRAEEAAVRALHARRVAMPPPAALPGLWYRRRARPAAFLLRPVRERGVFLVLAARVCGGCGWLATTPAQLQRDMCLFEDHACFLAALLDAFTTPAPPPPTTTTTRETETETPVAARLLPRLDDATMLHVLRFVDGFDLPAVARVCRRWQTLARAEALMRMRTGGVGEPTAIFCLLKPHPQVY